eukprot:Gb_23942 [translate_table: standard]
MIPHGMLFDNSCIALKNCSSFQMANDGYHQPQFSEDSAWLPTWLQPHGLTFGEQMIGSHPVAGTECKSFGDLPESLERTGAGYGSSCEMVRRNICPLFLSGDDCTATEKSQSLENALALHLYLSSEDNLEISPTRVHARSLQETCQLDASLGNYFSVPKTQQVDSNTNQNIHTLPSLNYFSDVAAAPISGDHLLDGDILIQAISQQTPCTELYVPGIIQEGDNANDIMCSYGGDTSLNETSELIANNTHLSSPHGTLANETLVPGQALTEKVQNSLKRQSRKRKSFDKNEDQSRDKLNDGELTAVDTDVAIGLTVAAAEALVISNLMESCSSSEILEAALKLKEARQMCGLDSFSDISTEHTDGVDNSWFEDLDDNIMKEAFADVGLTVGEDKASPIGGCSADAHNSDDAKKLTYNNSAFVSTKDEEFMDDFKGRSFTSPKIGPKNDGSQTQEDGVLFCETKVSLLGASISRCLDGITRTEYQHYDSLRKVQSPMQHAVGLPINQDLDVKLRKNCLPISGIMGSSGNSLSRNMGTIELQENISPDGYKKCDEEASLQFECLSTNKLIQYCSEKSPRKAVDDAAAITFHNHQISAVDEGMNCGSAKGDDVFLQPSLMCSPSWLNHAGDQIEELTSPGSSRSCQSLECQCEIRASALSTKEFDNAHNSQVNRIIWNEAPRPFNSRWFGGWTGLDAEIKANENFGANMCTRKPFMEETSYLTESSDIDIDNATPVQSPKHPIDIDCPVPDMTIEDLSSGNRETKHSLSQTSVRCSNSSLYDPLCSLVPCSLPLEDDTPKSNTNKPDIKGIDPVFMSKQHHERLEPLEKENTVQVKCGYTRSLLLGLNKPFQQCHYSDTEQTKTKSFSTETQCGIKRKRVDSLRNYSTLSKLLQIGSIEIASGNKETALQRKAVIVPDSMEGKLGDCPNADTMSRANSKEDRDNFSGVCLLKSANVTKDVGDLKDISENKDPTGKQSNFQNERPLNMHATTVPLISRNIGENNNLNNTDKICDDLGIALEVCLDVEESPPLLLHCRKRRRLRAYRTIESGTSEESNWDKTPSMCMNQLVNAVPHNAGDLEPAGDLLNGSALGREDLLEQTHSNLKGKSTPIKRVHFSEDIVKCRSGVDNCQNVPLENESTEHSQEHEVCSDLHGKMRQLGSSCRVQSTEAGMKRMQGDYGRACRENDEQKLRFKGLEFLLTGFSNHKKIELEKMIREHGGNVLSALPSLPHARVRGMQKTQYMERKLPIIVSSQQVRTTKFMYGCAVGSLLIRPGWITDSITEKCRLPYDKYLLRANSSNVCWGPKQKHSNTDKENIAPLFKGLRIMLYGKPAFCSKLTTLIKHGGGQVFRTIKCLVQENEAQQAAVAMIIVEDVRAAPRHLRHCASEYRLPVMSGNWIIESLLLGRLLPFRTNIASGLQSPRKKSHFGKSLSWCASRSQNISESEAVRLSGSKKISTVHSASSKIVKGTVSSKENLPCNGSIFCGQGVSIIPLAVPRLAIKLPGKYAEVSVKQVCPTNCLYYQKVVFKGLLYSIGDVVELKPCSESEESYLARIECLWAEQEAGVKTRTRKSSLVANSCGNLFLKCRWFYRPSNTGFPCTASGKEIYISNCFHDVLVQKIKRKVSVVFIVDGRVFPINAPNEKEGELSSCITMDDQRTDFVCKFFYDHENESLHQIKLGS